MTVEADLRYVADSSAFPVLDVNCDWGLSGHVNFEMRGLSHLAREREFGGGGDNSFPTRTGKRFF